jgi:large subunit ribosomal protein L4
MSSVDVKNAEGKTDGNVELPAHVFDVSANIPLMHQVVVAQQAAARQGTHSTKTRGEVRGGGRKPYRQKGTGRARQGSVRAPQFTGGGVVHGPTPRDYSQRTPKKMKAAALRGALSDRARGGRVHVVSGLVAGDNPSTKAARQALEAVVGSASRGVLVVVGREDSVNLLSLRNLPQVHLIAPDQLNTYDVLVNDDIVFTSDSLDAFLAGPVAAAPSKRRAAKIGLLKATSAGSDGDAAPHGAGSHAPLDDVSVAPEGFPIKGNEDSKLYHVPGSAFYDRTVAEVWFATAADAEAAGFALPPSQRKAAEEESK